MVLIGTGTVLPLPQEHAREMRGAGCVLVQRRCRADVSRGSPAGAVRVVRTVRGPPPVSGPLPAPATPETRDCAAGRPSLRQQQGWVFFHYLFQNYTIFPLLYS